MKNVNNALRRLTAFAAAAAVVSSFGLVSFADGEEDYDMYSPSDYRYSSDPGEYHPSEDPTADVSYDSMIFVSGNNLAPNKDNNEKLAFTIYNVSGSSITLMTNPVNGAIEKFDNDDEKWESVRGDRGKDPSFDNLSPEEIYSKSRVIAAGSEYSSEMDISFLDRGRYRMKLYIVSESGYKEDYIYFAVEENVSAESDKLIYTNDPVFNFTVRNDLPISIKTKYSKYLKLERLSDGNWVDSEIQFDNLNKTVAVNKGKKAKMFLSFSGINKFVAGEYRLSIKFLTLAKKYDEESTLPESKTVVMRFTVKDPVEASVMSATVSSMNKIYVPIKFVNRTKEVITVEKYGKLLAKPSNSWGEVKFKNDPKKFDGSVKIEPGEEKIVNIYLADYYRTEKLSIGVPYKMYYTAGGKEYYVGFNLYEGIIKSNKYDSKTDEHYYIIKETELED